MDAILKPWRWLLLATTPFAALAADSCKLQASAPATVVELYTSEGCSSCPPADRWLSTLKNRPDVLALAFHVNYWDRLGWPDRFASREATERQHRLAQAAGSRSVYTPQVIVDGQDWRGWPRLPAARATQPAPTVVLRRQGEQVLAEVGGSTDTRYAGYWAVLEDGHQSQVRAGENAGELLKHDHVVRLYQPVAAWSGAQKLQLSVSAGAATHPRRAAFVVTDAQTLRPLQAAVLALPPGC